MQFQLVLLSTNFIQMLARMRSAWYPGPTDHVGIDFWVSALGEGWSPVPCVDSHPGPLNLAGYGNAIDAGLSFPEGVLPI